MLSCDTCKNLRVDGKLYVRNNDGRMICQAFPDGIPDDILQGALHREVRDDQNNDIVYKSNLNSD